DGMRARRLRERELRVTAEKFGGIARARYPLPPEMPEQRNATAEVVEHHHPSAGAHELRELVDVEVLLRIEEEEAVVGLQLAEVDLRRRTSTCRPELRSGEAYELRAALPVAPCQVE